MASNVKTLCFSIDCGRRGFDSRRLTMDFSTVVKLPPVCVVLYFLWIKCDTSCAFCRINNVIYLGFMYMIVDEKQSFGRHDNLFQEYSILYKNREINKFKCHKYEYTLSQTCENTLV